MLTAFFHGFLLAFSLILPLGIQNIFIFTQGAVQKRFIDVIPIIMVAAFCDTLLILLAVLGISMVVLSIAWVTNALYSGFYLSDFYWLVFLA